MKIYILTQEDVFYLPKFFDKFQSFLPKSIDIVGVSILKGEIQKKNYIKYLHFLKIKGIFKFIFLFLKTKIFSLFCVFDHSISSSSVYQSFRRNNINIYKHKNINDEGFINNLSLINVDLLVSVACPQIIKKKLRQSVKYGAVNIHGSLLPKYRGMLPSFWVLYNNEASTGVTVHIVNDKIDDGPIVLQKSINILPNDTVHSLLLRSKIEFGPEVLINSILLLKSKELNYIENDGNKSSYFSFPSVEIINEFYKTGKSIF